MRSFLICMGCVIALRGHALSAQRTDDLVQGAKIRVQFKSGESISGIFQNLGPDSVAFFPSNLGVTRNAALNDVGDISVMAGPDRSGAFLRTGAKWGLIAAVSGGILGAVAYQPCEGWCYFAPPSRGRSAFGGAVVIGVPGFVIGGILGAVRAKETWTSIRFK